MKKITVLLQVKNAARDINDCIVSILNQTHRDFELLIINDHSSDLTMEVIVGFDDPRIKVIEGEFSYIDNLNSMVSV